jgi:hypothetical protein
MRVSEAEQKRLLAFRKRDSSRFDRMQYEDRLIYRFRRLAKKQGLKLWRVKPEHVGALTCAPLLSDYRVTRRTTHPTRKVRVWGWMRYQLESLQGSLADTSEATWQIG